MYDVVVIGLGGVGSFALRSLAKELKGTGQKILGLERYQLGHHKGSSHGETRIYRRAYFEDERYIPWIEHSIREFQTLEQESGTSILHECGNIVLQDKPQDDDNNKDAQQQERNYLQLAQETAQRQNIQVEFLDQKALKSRFPQFRYHEDKELIGLYEPNGGFVRSEVAMAAALAQAQAVDEVTIWENTVVQSIQEMIPGTTDSHVEVKVRRQTKSVDTEDLTVTSKIVLIAAGAWASQLIPSWSEHLTITRQVQGWVDVATSADPLEYSPETFPTWIRVTSKYPLPFFGVPVSGENQEGKHYTKVGIHNDRIHQIDDPTHNPTQVSDEEREEYLKAVEVVLDRRAWHGQKDLSPDQVRVIPCMYTMTPDENFLMGVPHEFQSVYAIAGLSGHGFKMAPALGQILADFCLVGEKEVNSKWKPHEFCSPSRFD